VLAGRGVNDHGANFAGRFDATDTQAMTLEAPSDL
jgi:hypothetical protein